MNKIEQLVKDKIVVVIKDLYDYDAQSDVHLEIPKDNSFGDYSSNVAMRLSKKLGMAPRVLAEALQKALGEDVSLFSEVSIAGPGFINFRIAQHHFGDVINTIIKEKDDYGRNTTGNNIKVNVEYVSANPTGDLHPGHARGAATGDALTRIMKFSGYDVTREFYLNDAGVQIDMMARSLQARYLELFNLDVTFPEEGYKGQDIIDIAVQLKAEVNDAYVDEDMDKHILAFRAYGLEAETEKLKRDLALFRVEFDVWSKESDIYAQNKVETALNKVKDSGYTYEEDGALWLQTTAFGDDKDRVLVKSDKNYTYLTPDIAYHQDKFDRGYDRLINLFGADHHGYINRLKASMQILGYDKDQLDVEIIQMALMFKDGEEFKMSKRTGKSISLRELILETDVDALRYLYVDRAPDSPMTIDLDLALQKTNENPVYYAQYAHARMNSILVQGEKYEVANSFELINHEKEVELIKHLNEFTNVVSDAAKSQLPNKISNYISRLANLFHSFYGANKVLDESNVVLTEQRLGLVLAAKIVLKNALNLIGVSAPDSM
ncbi:MAG: arginine--tRNA ligase [Erysipelothrix sp.]|nr:arginine--tRNA ligase [Erysipelothrix sp.]